MSDLSAETQALLKRVSSADDPTQADRDRVLAMIGTALVAPIAPPPAGAAGAGTAGAAATAGTVKLVLAFVISLGVGGVATTAGTSLFRASKAAPIVEQVVVPPPPPAVEALAPVVQVSEVEVEPEPAVVAAAPTVAAPVVRKPPPPVAVEPAPAPTPAVVIDRPVALRDDACELSAELSVIQQAQQALKTSPAQAIAGLDAFGARCPSGALLEERLATRALALCASGRKDDGRAAAQELGERFPASPSLDRVNQACGQ